VKQKRGHTISVIGCLLAAFACLSPSFAFADNDSQPVIPMFGLSQAPKANSQPLILLPMQKDQSAANLAFDLGGSESRKLELQLSRPLTLAVGSSTLTSSSGVGSVFLDNTLDLRLNDNLDITASLGAGKSGSAFQPLGSIHCQNGVLDQGSFHASDCYFINQANVLKQDQVALGLRYGKGNFNSSVNMFRRETGFGQQGVVNPTTPMPGAYSDMAMLAPGAGARVLQPFNNGPGLDYMNSETTGLDIEFQVGFAMDSAGDIRLGLQLTHILDASYDTSSTFNPSLDNWTIASPFDSARMNLDWSKGNFSGGIQGYYREQIQFLNNQALDSSTTFDVHFTWRAPWNANFSVGTSNVLGAGGRDKGNNDTGLQDPFEAVYGRIPYVRYQQDL